DTGDRVLALLVRRRGAGERAVGVRDPDSRVGELLAVRGLDDARDLRALLRSLERASLRGLLGLDRHGLRGDVLATDDDAVGTRCDLGLDLERALLRLTDPLGPFGLRVVGVDRVALLEALDRRRDGPDRVRLENDRLCGHGLALDGGDLRDLTVELAVGRVRVEAHGTGRVTEQLVAALGVGLRRG